jgi:hypothetical protein
VSDDAREGTSWTPHSKKAAGAAASVLVGRNVGAVQDIRPVTTEYDNYFTRGPSRGVVDLAKAYLTDSEVS